MRKYLLLFVCALYSVLCTPLFAKVDKQTVVLSCNLHCQGCCNKIMKNIAFEKGVKDLKCDLRNKVVTVVYDANKTDVATLLKAFERIGKPATVLEPLAPDPDPAPVRSDSPSGAQTDAETGASVLYPL
jgi:copper chaperone CopZ